jgi:ectoine hydroxylase-related dioxygenase (phytanoyl-CoA dioxygenase family)
MNAPADFYQKHGYAAVNGIVGAREIADLRKVTDEFVELSRSVTASDDVFDVESQHTAERPRLRRLKSPERQHPAYDALLRSNAVLDVVAQFLGPDIRFWSGKLNLKPPEGGQAVEWHQDWAFGPATNDNMLTVGIALDDLMLVNGCLMVVPESHTGPVYDHRIDGRFVGAVAAAGELGLQSKAVPIEVPVGGISIHHIRTLHASAPNHSALQRRLLLFTYAAADAWPLDGPGDAARFDQKMVRGRPPVAPRLDRVPVTAWPRWSEEEKGAATSLFDLQKKGGQSSFAP